MKAKAPVRNKRPYGPNIVRAWFDTVIHFALRGLENEAELVAARNWSFQSGTRKLQYIAPLVAHVPRESRENLEQFVSFHASVGDAIRRHDDCANELERRCNELFQAIIECPEFQQAYDFAVADSPSVLGREFSSNFAYDSEADFRNVLADHLINNVSVLPSYHRAAAL